MLPQTSIVFLYYFVGDVAFLIHRHFLRPFTSTNLTIPKRVFNYRLTRARKFVECTFGILSKWRIFHRTINVEPDFATDIVKACVILNNFVRSCDGYKFRDAITISGLEDLQPPEERMIRGNQIANNMRNQLAVIENTNLNLFFEFLDLIWEYLCTICCSRY